MEHPSGGLGSHPSGGGWGKQRVPSQLSVLGSRRQHEEVLVKKRGSLPSNVPRTSGGRWPCSGAEPSAGGAALGGG